MKIQKKIFSEDLKSIIDGCKNFVIQNFNLKPVNNVNLLAEKIIATKDIDGAIVECGVYKGNTLFPVAELCRRLKINKHIYGYDTFAGFPDNKIDYRDHPSMFKTLFQQKKINQEYYNKAASRTNNFNDTAHLQTEYFLDVQEVFNNAKNYPQVKLIIGKFIDTLPNHQESIIILYIDCDLYQGYKDCLNLLYEKIIKNGVIIFDEYYSLKYPGARIAVDEFFIDKKGHFEVYRTEDDFERWCFIKE